MFETMFDFETKSLSYNNIENAICSRLQLGMPSSSDFTEIVEGKAQSITIFANKGNVKCSVRAFKKKDSEQYTVSCSSIIIKKKRK